jgi:hypothetical protein
LKEQYGELDSIYAKNLEELTRSRKELAGIN